MLIRQSTDVVNASRLKLVQSRDGGSANEWRQAKVSIGKTYLMADEAPFAVGMRCRVPANDPGGVSEHG